MVAATLAVSSLSLFAQLSTAESQNALNILNNTQIRSLSEGESLDLAEAQRYTGPIGGIADYATRQIGEAFRLHRRRT